MRSIVSLDGASLRLEDVETVALRRARVRLAPAARRSMARARRVIDRLARGSDPIYGVNTGFGRLKDIRISPARLDALQINLIRSHCAGVGEPLEDGAVRALILLRANVLARGYSGVRPGIVEALLVLLNRDVLPRIPSQGSVGASGDLAPLAHLALALMGEGTVRAFGRELPARRALARIGLAPVRLKAKEGIALINGTQMMTAVGALVLARSENLARHADLAGALSLEALRGSRRAFDRRLERLRPHPGHAVSASNLRRLLGHSQVERSHADCGRVQDGYSLRCMPQVHGASRDAIAHVRGVLQREINAVTDNPILFAGKNELLPGGNFHGQPVSLALDYLSMALAGLACISERRVERLTNPDLSGLPAFLTRDPGFHSGFMMAQVTAAALVSENKGLAHPASVDSIPTSAAQEDHVSMGAWAARKALRILENAERVLAIEILAACQGLELLLPLKTSPPLRAALRAVRRVVPSLGEDRVLSEDIERMTVLLQSGKVLAAAQSVAGGLQ